MRVERCRAGWQTSACHPACPCYVSDLAIGFATYLVVVLLHMRRIGRVLLSLVLKAQE